VALRVGVAFGLALAVARTLPAGRPILALPEAALVVAVYGVVLLVTRELGKDDVRLVQRIVKRRA